jgi:hypothetical protein
MRNFDGEAHGGTPSRLVTGSGRLADGLRQLAESTASGAAPDQAWNRVTVRLHESPRRWGRPVLVTSMAAAALAAIMIGVLLPKRGPHVTKHTTPATQEVQHFALASGDQEWPGAWAHLNKSGVGRVEISKLGTRVVLESGALALRFADSPATNVPYVVEVRSIKYVTRAAIFHVTAGADTELSVEAGKVSVELDGRQVAMVEAGQRWPAAAQAPQVPASSMVPKRSSPALTRRTAPSEAPSPVTTLAPATTPPPATVPSPSVAPVAANCAVVEREGRHQAALHCYEQQGAGSGLQAETALYEIGRIRRDRLGDTAGALKSFESCRQRFPQGALRYEVDLSVLELLARLGRHAEALVESARLLESHPRGERAGEIRLLRGNIMRERLRDCVGAEREYAAATTTRGRTGDDAAFFRAGCLELLGRRDVARDAYREFLRRGSERHRSEAQRRLDALDAP